MTATAIKDAGEMDMAATAASIMSFIPVRLLPYSKLEPGKIKRNLSPTAVKCFEGFHSKAVCHLTGMRPKKGRTRCLGLSVVGGHSKSGDDVHNQSMY